MNWHAIKINQSNSDYGWLAGFYGISTLLGYLISNPVYTYIY